jgi:outer membrane protein assembly factor BamE (lipoprotein component of BamABCDE complex)
MFPPTLAAEAASVNASASLRMKNISKTRHILLAAALAFGLPACSPDVEMRGNLPYPDLLTQIQVGKTTREDVQALLGTPSTVSMFGDETWHYVSQRTESVAFFDPEIKDRKIVTVIFDRSGTVRALDSKGLADGKTVHTVDRETPTAGKEMTLLQQLMGNVGRFSKDAKEK